MTGTIQKVPGNRHFFLLIVLSCLLFVIGCSLANCRLDREPWEGTWQGTPMKGYALTYRLGQREYSMEMRDTAGNLVMASKGTLEASPDRLLVTETSRFLASDTAGHGTWKTCNDLFQVQWSLSDGSTLNWSPIGSGTPIVLARTGN